MNKLEQVYAAIKMLEDLGLPVSSEQRKAVKEAEKEYIDSELIPFIEKEISPFFENVKNPLDLAISYNGKTLSVKRVQDEVTRTERSHTKDINAIDEPRKKKFILRVTFPDGRVVCQKKVSETFVEAVKYAGVDRVEKLNIEILGQNMISTVLFENERYKSGQYLVDDKYITTYCDTERKFNILKEIANSLHLGLKIEKVSIKDTETIQETQGITFKRFDRTMYSLEGRPFCTKGRFVHDLVAQIMEDNPSMTYEELAKILPERSVNNSTIIRYKDWIQKTDDARSRYLYEKEEEFTDGKGVKFFVSTQWTKEKFDKDIIPVMKKLGYNWEEK